MKLVWFFFCLQPVSELFKVAKRDYLVITSVITVLVVFATAVTMATIVNGNAVMYMCIKDVLEECCLERKPNQSI